LKFIFKDKISYLIISIFGAVFHNLGQLAAVSLIYTSVYIWTYLPVLLIFGVIAGMLVFGYLARWTASLYRKQDSSIFSKINYAILFPYFLQIVCRGYFSQIFLESLFTFVPIIAAAYFSNRVMKTRKILQ
jgi:hypothetical protein